MAGAREEGARLEESSSREEAQNELWVAKDDESFASLVEPGRKREWARAAGDVICYWSRAFGRGSRSSLISIEAIVEDQIRLCAAEA